MQQIIGSGQAQLRNACFTLCLENIDDCACEPLRITDIHPRHHECTYFPDDCTCGEFALNVCIPLDIALTDSRGCRVCAASSITVRVPMRFLCNARDICQQQFIICAQVRPSMLCRISCKNSVQVHLDVCVQAWAVRCRALQTPLCPDVCPPAPPLYPQPCRPLCR